jgi:hypothetical protein
MGEMRNVYKIWVRKPEGKILIRYIHRWKYIIKRLREVGKSKVVPVLN